MDGSLTNVQPDVQLAYMAWITACVKAPSRLLEPAVMRLQSDLDPAHLQQQGPPKAEDTYAMSNAYPQTL